MPNYAPIAGAWRSRVCDVPALPLPDGRGSDRTSGSDRTQLFLGQSRFRSEPRPSGSGCRTTLRSQGRNILGHATSARYRSLTVAALTRRSGFRSEPRPSGSGCRTTLRPPGRGVLNQATSPRNRSLTVAALTGRDALIGHRFGQSRFRSEPRPSGSGCRTTLRSQGRNILGHATSARYRSLTVAALIRLPHGRSSDRTTLRSEPRPSGSGCRATLRSQGRNILGHATSPRYRSLTVAALIGQNGFRSEPRPSGSGCRTTLRPQGRGVLEHAMSPRYRSLTVAALIGLPHGRGSDRTRRRCNPGAAATTSTT